MKNAKISRRSFLKAGAVASAVGMLSAAPVAAHAAETDASAAADEENGLLDVFKKPKYVFLFIGDGMGTAQIQSARFYKGTVDNNGAVTEADLSFTSFPQVGSVTTYDSTSFCPDSASTATSIATGHKTESGVINMCPWTRDVPYETIAEKLHAQKGYKVGVISTVNIDHATPAAFYAHQKTRKNYYEIGVELANSGFEYFAGGEFQKVNGDGTGPDNHTVAANAGYNVVTTQAGAAALTAGAGKTLIIAENLGDGKAMNYAMDAASGEWQLTDYVKKGIELLNNKKGFFMMTESGKIDWACHANDAAASIHDVLEMSNAVQAAVDFYNEHPNETLILVTADHETGGMAIGYKTTNYDTFLTNLAHQKMSYAKFDATYVQGYIANKTPFETAMQDVKNVFGLTLPTDPAAASAGKLLLTDYEVENLRKAYERTLQVGSSGAAGSSGFLCRELTNLITTNSTKATMRKLMMELTNSPILMLEPPRPMTTSEKSALKNRPISGLMMSSTSAVTMAVKAPPMTTPTAMSSTLPRMANALNSSRNFLMPLFFSSIDKPLLLVPFFLPQGVLLFL